MKRFVSLVAVFLLVFAVGQTYSADNLITAVSKIEAGIANVLQGIGDALSRAATEAGKAGPGCEADIRKHLQACMAGKPYAIDSTFIDSKGIMKFVEPKSYGKHEGTNISEQQVVIRMLKEKQPQMGDAFLSVEGIQSIDIEYPVFSQEKRFLGSISILIRHDEMIRSIVERIDKGPGVNCFVMQKDGLILYEADAKQIGRNTFTDPLFKDFPELIALGKRMLSQKEGTGFYSFVVPGTKEIVKKRAAWKTIHFFNNDWIVVAHREVKQ